MHFSAYKIHTFIFSNHFTGYMLDVKSIQRTRWEFTLEGTSAHHAYIPFTHHGEISVSRFNVIYCYL